MPDDYSDSARSFIGDTATLFMLLPVAILSCPAIVYSIRAKNQPDSCSLFRASQT
jgi:hypothetical protein